MDFDIIEVITLLLGMSGFGLGPNAKPPTADQALVYAIPDADLVAHVDTASVIPGNFRLLSQLADQPQIKASPELQKLVRKTLGEVEGARGMAKLATGIDLTTDVSDATAFVRFAPGGPPTFVITVHGAFAVGNLDKIAKTTNGTVAPLGAGSIIELGAPQPSIGLTRDGVMLIGTSGLVRERLADTWKAPAHGGGTPLATAAEVIDAHPVLAFAMTMSPSARAEVTKQFPGPGFAADVVIRHKAAAFSLYRDGIGWLWLDSTRTGLDAMEQISSGVLDLLRAAQIAPRGVAKIAMGAIESYRGTSPQVDSLIKHKADLLKIIETYTGDGTFKVTVDKNPKMLRLAVRATGKSASDVVPFGMVLPIGLLAWLDQPRSTAQTIATPPPPAPAKKPTPQPVPINKPRAVNRLRM